jgi:hypothetical protein
MNEKLVNYLCEMINHWDSDKLIEEILSLKYVKNFRYKDSDKETIKNEDGSITEKLTTYHADLKIYSEEYNEIIRRLLPHILVYLNKKNNQ